MTKRSTRKKHITLALKANRDTAGRFAKTLPKKAQETFNFSEAERNWIYDLEGGRYT